MASDNILGLTKEVIKEKADELKKLGVEIEKIDLDGLSKEVVKKLGENSNKMKSKRIPFCADALSWLAL